MPETSEVIPLIGKLKDFLICQSELLKKIREYATYLSSAIYLMAIMGISALSVSFSVFVLNLRHGADYSDRLSDKSLDHSDGSLYYSYKNMPLSQRCIIDKALTKSVSTEKGISAEAKPTAVKVRQDMSKTAVLP
ncbi:unnamed protein product [Cylicostephanus goldi]|uniref:Uncharacterized protein n=1 Tax=Cylicostephanus goldi TaxID=71465 RepID=A0A3P6QHS0_CYLGO|nr:unnamed protein product [Cylicostephanus goldi]